MGSVVRLTEITGWLLLAADCGSVLFLYLYVNLYFIFIIYILDIVHACVQSLHFQDQR